ncbi:MAG: hypothetical protein IJ567_07060 [Lachnospiraceae bacterium]|nr:hypothetical protein [Lachnospiraceae bacterium]
MFECPSCGGELRFDISSQSMLCAYCKETYDPKVIDKDEDAQEQQVFDATVFTCPQCGGEILSTDNEATSFCSFCGAATILSARISKERRPNYIIPFQITKEDCKEAYRRMMKGAIFAPKELKDPDSIDQFRGIYMPYWVYFMRQEGDLNLKGSKSYRSGNYRITEYYDVSGELDAYYKGLSYDASSSFADNISESIAPYDVKGMNQFMPSYLAGFYADTADVEKELYLEEATEIANDATLKALRKVPELQKAGVSLPSGSADQVLHTECKNIDSAVFPVWFLSYRKNDRVAYATVNGQTGKVASDLPVDTKKYLLGSLLLTVPIFLLLNLFFTVTPNTAMLLTSCLAFAALAIHIRELRQIGRVELYLDNKGYRSKMGDSGDADTSLFEKKQKQKKRKRHSLGLTIFFAIFICTFLEPFFAFFFVFTASVTWIVNLVLLVIAIVLSVSGFRMSRNIPDIATVPGFLGSLVAIIIMTGVSIWNPVQDSIYYGAIILAFVAVVFTLVSLIHAYNIQATRPLPQFNKRGGEENA